VWSRLAYLPSDILRAPSVYTKKSPLGLEGNKGYLDRYIMRSEEYIARREMNMDSLLTEWLWDKHPTPLYSLPLSVKINKDMMTPDMMGMESTLLTNRYSAKPIKIVVILMKTR
jgi:hypothetical protein